MSTYNINRCAIILLEESRFAGVNMCAVMVRRFREEDVEDVLEIFSSLGLIYGDEKIDGYRKLLRRMAKEPPWYDLYLVAELDGRVVGRVILEAACPPYSELINLYVHPDYQGRGVGSRLVQACIKEAAGLGCSVMSAMTDPVGNLPAHRLYSKFGFRPGILGDPSSKRGHTWLFRFSEKSCVAAFLREHPFAEPHVSRLKVDFHGRPLYRMMWRDPQKGEALVLYLEGQPSQTPEGTMPRVAGFSYREGEIGLGGIIREGIKTIREGENSRFTVSLWNTGSKRLEAAFNASIPKGTRLSPAPEDIQLVGLCPKEEKRLQFELTWLPGCRLSEFTTFPTVLVTCFFLLKALGLPLLTSAGFKISR